MNNKPYIWMDDLDTWFTDEDYQNLDDLLKEGMFPLYTHPAKELTDEEIVSLINKHIDYVPDGDGMKLVGVMDFARAILRKAQENG